MAILNLKKFQIHELKPVDMKVNKEIICLSGASGSGKSLFLRAIADLIEHEGEAYLDEQKCSAINPVQWRKEVGFLPAESAWWMDAVGNHFNEKNIDNLSSLNLADDCFTWDVSRCSTGEKQRLAIVRLLEQKPKVLLLDEPTASLDSNSVEAVEMLIKRYSKEFDVPVIWVSHDKQQIERIADRQFKIENNEMREVRL